MYPNEIILFDLKQSYMRHIYFFAIYLLALISPKSLFAQIFSSSFEDLVSNEWAVSSGSGLTVFERTTAAKRTGNYGFHLQFNALDQKGNLQTPVVINWELGKTYRVSYYFKVISPAPGNDSHIKTFEGDGTKFGSHLYGGNVINNTTTSTDWIKFEDIITPNKNDTGGYALFTFRSTASGGEYYLDDFLIEEVVEEPNFFEDIKTKDISSEATIKWTQFGPGMSGNNRCFYTHPTDPNTHYTSPNMGNSYRSTDGGFTYETIMNEDARSYNTGYRGPIEMYCLDFSRQDANYGFCTGKGLGDLYVSSDKGKTWQLQESTQGVIGNNYLSVVAVDPSDDNIWFLGAGRMRDYARVSYPQSSPKGDYLDPNANGRIWKSTNKGQTWSLSNTGINTSAEFETILVDPVDNSIVYAGTNYGFYKSTDGGANWTLKSNGIDHDMIRSMDLHHDKTTGQITIYVLSNITWKVTASGNSVENDQGGIFKSTDRGETWTNVSGNLNMDLTVFSGDSTIMTDYYQCLEHYFGLASEAAAKTAYPTVSSSLTPRFNTITVDPNDVDNVYLINDFSNQAEGNFGPGQIWRTTNGGTSWFVTFRNGKNWNNGIHDAYWVTERNNPMGTNITMKYKSDWINRDDYERKGCNFTRFNANGSVLYTQLAKVGFVSYDKGDTWVDIDDEEANESGSILEGWVGAGNSNVPGHGLYQSELWPGKVFCPSGENSLWITNDEGGTVRLGAQGGSVMDLVFYNGERQEHSVSSVVVHPTDKNTWFATFFRQWSRGKVYKTTDAGANWSAIGEPIPQPWAPAPPGSGDQAVHQLGLMIDKNNPDIMYFCVPRSTLKLEWVGDSCQSWGVHKSTDGGATWNLINTGLPSSLDVARIAFDPNNSNTIYAAVIDSGGGLFKSTNGGATWSEVASTTAISGSSGINDIHFDVDGKAYITAGFKNEDINNGGLWVSDDNMVTWTQLFDYPWTNRVEVSKLDTSTIMVSTLPNAKVGFRNAGTYLSKDGGATWVKFNKGNGQSDRVNDIAIDYTVPGKYYVSTRGSGWYTAIDPNPNTTLAKEDTVAYSDVLVYPNPSRNTLNIKGIKSSIDFNIYAIDGKRLLEFKNSETRIFDISSLTTGLYIYTISNEGIQVKSGKFIKL